MARENQTLRGPRRVAAQLKGEMDARGVTAKELALQLKGWAAEDPTNRWPVDYRTIQHAMQGTACALDTYLVLAGYFGWDFAERVQAPIHGADQLTALEKEIDRERAEIAAREARLERLRAAGLARRAVAAGGLRLVPEEDRAWRSSRGSRGGDLGAGGDC